MEFILEGIKAKLVICEKQNAITINTTNRIIEENLKEIQKILEISHDKDLNIVNLDEELKKKCELIAKIEEKLYSIPILEHKIDYINNEYEREKNRLNQKLLKTVDRYEKLLNKEINKNQSLNELNKTINQSLDERFYLSRHSKNLEKEVARMKSIMIQENLVNCSDRRPSKSIFNSSINKEYYKYFSKLSLKI